MSWKWGGRMSSKCIYYVEGLCEQQLIAALKENPARLISGKVRVFNVIQNLIPKSQMISIQAGTTVVLVFDTDVPQTTNLRKNRKKRYSQLALLYDKLELVGNISPTFE